MCLRFSKCALTNVRASMRVFECVYSVCARSVGVQTCLVTGRRWQVRILAWAAPMVDDGVKLDRVLPYLVRRNPTP